MPGYKQVLLNDNPNFLYRIEVQTVTGLLSFLQMSDNFDSNHCLVLGKR